MKKIIFLAGSFFFFAHMHAQYDNLIKNPGFEGKTSPASTTFAIGEQDFNDAVPSWKTLNSADYFNSNASECEGFPLALAHTGEGRVGIIMGQKNDTYREFIEGNLSQPLQKGKIYCVKFFVALDHSCVMTSDNVGACLTSDPTFTKGNDYYHFNPPTPQIVHKGIITSEMNWVLISGYYTAKGGEQYITIGNFADKSQHAIPVPGVTDLDNPRTPSTYHIWKNAFFYLDDVSVTLCDDTTNCACSPKNATTAPSGDHYLFLLDISGSMKTDGKLDLMKDQIKQFSNSLNGNNRVGIMSFSDESKVILPFTSPAEVTRIDTTIDNLKTHGSTGGDHAVHQVFRYVDSLHVSSGCHIIIATDGVFSVTDRTITYADSVQQNENMDFGVFQFGNKTNDRLKQIVGATPKGFYKVVHKVDDVQEVMEKLKPPKVVDTNTVVYTKMKHKLPK